MGKAFDNERTQAMTASNIFGFLFNAVETAQSMHFSLISVTAISQFSNFDESQDLLSTMRSMRIHRSDLIYLCYIDRLLSQNVKVTDCTRTKNRRTS